MAGMGPPPKDPAKRARTNVTAAGTRQLPGEGRTGQQPGWPLVADVTLTVQRDMARTAAAEALADLDFMTGAQAKKREREYEAAVKSAAIFDGKLKAQRRREREVWNQLWRTPQAVAWEQLGWNRDVAMYVRHTVLAELGDMDHAKEARQWSDRLGLSPMAMLRLRWEIVADQVTERREERTAAQTGGSSRARRGPLTSVATGT